MLVLGLLLLAAGIVAILGALFSTSGSASLFGADVGAATLFFLGVAATLAVLCGLVLTRAGTGRAWRHRREHRRLRTLERERDPHQPPEQGDDNAVGTREDAEPTRENPPEE